MPDEVKVAKIYLKDLITGKLIYCKLPPGDPEHDNIWTSNDLSEFKSELK